jgi:hypothetical protein
MTKKPLIACDAIAGTKRRPYPAQRPPTQHPEPAEPAAQPAGPLYPDDILNTAQLATRLGVSPTYLALGRTHGYGPAFHRISPTIVRYRWGDVLTWLAEFKQSSTTAYDTHGRGRPKKTAVSA